VPGATVNIQRQHGRSKDFNDTMKSHLPLVFGFVLGAAFLLLLVTFRSLVIPIKALVLNLLSVAASYGVLTLVFQHGWGESLLGFEAGGGITSWLLLFLFVVLFGLSMDYHVFILSRIREAVLGGASTEAAVSDGIKSTAGVVTSAALVMIAVFSVFATLGAIEFKQMGVGLAAAILIDATIVRSGAAARDDEAPRRLKLVPAPRAVVAAEGRRQRRLDAARMSRAVPRAAARGTSDARDFEPGHVAEVLVEGVERESVRDRRCGDERVRNAESPAGAPDRRDELPVAERHECVDGQCVKRALRVCENAEAHRSLLSAGKRRAEVKLGEGHRRDRGTIGQLGRL